MMNYTNMPQAASHRLGELIRVKAGYPWRGAIPVVKGGSVIAIQAKDISDIGEVNLTDCVRTRLTGKRDADWLQRGDVLLINKGNRSTAAYIECDLPNTTCPSSIYLLQVNPLWQQHLNMQFIAWQLNQQPLQTYLRRSAEGSSQVSLRKQVVEDAILAIPDLHTQNLIAKLYVAAQKEHNALIKLIENRKSQMSAISKQLLTC